MIITQELIQKLLDNQCNSSEVKYIIDYFDNHPDEVDSWLSLQEWNRYRAGVRLYRGLSDKMWMKIENSVVAGRSVSSKKIYRWAAIAASVLIMAGGAWMVTMTPGKKNGNLAQKCQQEIPRLVRLVNASDTVRQIFLRDGSVVQLQQHSGISYYEPFAGNRRDISLKGIALFMVAKDKTRPFTVYAGGMATTALGTKFWVDAADTKKVAVRLLEGKVVIAATPGSGIAMERVFLIPGEEFSISKTNGQMTVKSLTGNIAAINKAATGINNIGLVFNKEPLNRVFEKIGLAYKVYLSFEPKELEGLYFTGTFLQTDDLQVIVSTICSVNELTFKREQDTILITKSE